MFDYVRVASAVPEVSVCNPEKNAENIIKIMDSLKGKDIDILTLPELTVTGYSCGDLFFQDSLIKKSEEAVNEIVKASSNTDFATVLGSVVKIGHELYNCAIVIAEGKIQGIVPKTFLPNYNEYTEKRWFTPARDLSVTEVTPSLCGFEGDYKIPVGSNLIFRMGKAVTFGAELCEDMWAAISPANFLTVNGAEIILNLSASNETIPKRKYRQNIIKQMTAQSICAYVYSSAGYTESTTDFIYSGHSLVAECGKIISENEKYIDTDYVLIADIDTGKIKADRLKIKTFGEAAAMYGSLYPSKIVEIMPQKEFKSTGSCYKVSSRPFVPSNEKEREGRCGNIFEMQIMALMQRLSSINCKAVIGVSGGLDSTLALLVCAEAMKRLNRPSTDVIGITMPCFGTTDRTYNNSLELMKSLGITVMNISIKDSCIQHMKDIGHDINVHDVTYENTQARERTQVLMDIANKEGAIVVGTGDLSELALGWCTYNGDHMSMYGVNGSIPKTLLRWMIETIAESDMFPESSAVLRDIVDTPISPELLPPDEKGKIAQKTEEVVGSYTLHDFFLYYMLRYGFAPSKVYHLAQAAFKGEFDKKAILSCMKTFYRRFLSQQFKRNCLPDGVKIGTVGLSPRGDWHMPSDITANLWLEELEHLE